VGRICWEDGREAGKLEGQKAWMPRLFMAG
jgi:hypothetical protein